MTVHLIALKGKHFELYAEPPETVSEPPGLEAGWYRRWSHTAGERWRGLVETARRGEAVGRFARWRDALVCHLAETLSEQRTLWALRREADATLLYPATLDAPAARQAMNQVLAQSRWHHGVWLVIDTLLLVGSAILAPIPGPNAIAYYLAFRVVGHLQSWRGAHRGLTRTGWTLTPDPYLAELSRLAHEPRAARASRLADIAAHLHLPHLPAYFDRIAA
jgi:hypothetical protein